jgi:hypothetical protein
MNSTSQQHQIHVIKERFTQRSPWDTISLSHRPCKNPPGSLYLLTRGPQARSERGQKNWPAWFVVGDRRRWGWRGGETRPRQSAPVGNWNRLGASCGGGSTETVRPATGKNGGKGIPVVRRGKGGVQELQGKSRKLGVQPIKVGGSWKQVFHGGQNAAAMENSGSSSGSRCNALGIKLMGRRAS